MKDPLTDYVKLNCPVHGTEMIYSMARDEYACQTLSCVYGPGIGAHELYLIVYGPKDD